MDAACDLLGSPCGGACMYVCMDVCTSSDMPFNYCCSELYKKKMEKKRREKL